jgi:hypothetical protein
VDRFETITAALREQGLEARGAFHPGSGDVADFPKGRAVRTIVLAGQVGASLWPRFERESQPERDPLDRWSARALDAVAVAFDAVVALPNDGPPHPPFLHWAQRAEPVHASPLGLLIHPDYGLWHAYRGALLFAERFALPPRDLRPSPCASCADRPCLRACPVAAFSAAGFDDARCASHLESSAADACFRSGCLARAACPIGRDHSYPAAQARFHLDAFLRGRRQSV